MNINELPVEILEKIFSFLTTKEKFQYECVCRHWQQNLFTSIQSLSFASGRSRSCSFHKHLSTTEEQYSCGITSNSEVLQCILLKCGKYIRSFRGHVSAETAQIIADKCERLQCFNMSFDDLQDLKLLGDKFGKQLTCATLYGNLEEGFVSFISGCPNLVSLAFVAQGKFFNRHNSKQNSTKSIAQTSELLQSLPLLKTLVIDFSFDPFSNLKLEELPLFSNLASISIDFPCLDLDQLPLQKLLAASWTSLRSLSVNVSTETCAQFFPLPPNLENLFLTVRKPERRNYEPLIFTSDHPKLKVLKIFCYSFSPSPAYLNALFSSISAFLSSLEIFSFRTRGTSNIFECLDVIFEPLLSLKFLKRLSLPHDFRISDEFALQLITSLENLTSFGEEWVNSRGINTHECLLPDGARFWETLQLKAITHSSEYFYLIGMSGVILHLNEPLPSNVILCLSTSASVSLSKAFGKSRQWVELAERSYRLQNLVLEIKDNNFSLKILPKYLERLSISYIKESEGVQEDTFFLNHQLPNLSSLKIFQNYMTNPQLEATLESISSFCPKLTVLCLDRGNKYTRYTDEHVTCLLKCKALEKLCITHNFPISDKLGSELIKNLKYLFRVGCTSSGHKLGINCGSLFLKALVDKALKGKTVELVGGPSREEIMDVLGMSVLPCNLTVSPYRPAYLHYVSPRSRVDHAWSGFYHVYPVLHC